MTETFPLKILSLNEIIIYYELLSNILLKNEKYELPIELKIKVLQNRFNVYSNYKNYIEYIENNKNELFTDRYNELLNKKDKSDEEISELNEIISDINIKIEKLSQEKLNETCIVKFEYFDDNDFEELIKTNIENYPIINNQQLTPEVFLQYIFDNLVIPIPYNIEYKEESSE
jgi:hypothetical protein